MDIWRSFLGRDDAPAVSQATPARSIVFFGFEVFPFEVVGGGMVFGVIFDLRSSGQSTSVLFGFVGIFVRLQGFGSYIAGGSVIGQSVFDGRPWRRDDEVLAT